MNATRVPETYAVLGAAMEVHRELGHGFLEVVYQTALALELVELGILYKAEVALPIRYKGRLLTCSYRADFICFESVLVETKAIAQLTGADRAQVINALKATGSTRGLLLNFGAPRLEYERFAFDPAHPNHLRTSATSADEIHL